MPQFFTDLVDISPGATTGWQEIDISAHVAADAALAVVFVVYNGNVEAGVRHPSSTDDLSAIGISGSSDYFTAGILNQKIDLYKDSANITYYLVGYFNSSESGSFSSAIDKSLGTAGSWQTIDLSGDVPAGTKYACFIALNTITSYGYNLRNFGSTDDRKPGYGTKVQGIVVPVDGSRRCEGYIENLAVDFYLVGYITAGTRKVNGLDKSLGTTGSYQDIDLVADAPADAMAVLIEVNSGVSSTLDNFCRAKGSSDDYYKNVYLVQHAIVKLDTNKVLQGKIEHLNVNYYVQGYFQGTAPPVAAFSASPLLGGVPSNVTFTDSSSGSPTNWTWYYKKDGIGSWIEFATIQHPTHLFDELGIYDIKLTVVNAGGADDEIKTTYITVTNSGSMIADLPAVEENGGASGMNCGVTDIPLFNSDGSGMNGVIADLSFPICISGYWMIASDGTLPALEGEALLIKFRIDVNAILPILTGTGTFINPFTASASLPFLTTAITAISGTACSVDVNLPFLAIDAQLTQMILSSARTNLPILSSTVIHLTGELSSSVANLPMLISTGQVALIGATTGSVVVILPMLKSSSYGNIIPQVRYRVFTLNLKNMGLSEYDAYNYTGICKFKDKYYGVKPGNQGIYLLEGADDNGTPISSIVETGRDMFRTRGLKYITDAFITMKASGEYVLTLIDKDGNEYDYPLTSRVLTMETCKTDTGKGKRSQAWGFKFKNIAGAKFEVESIELNVIESRKRHG